MIGTKFTDGSDNFTVVAKSVYKPCDYIVEGEEYGPQLMDEAEILSYLHYTTAVEEEAKSDILKWYGYNVSSPPLSCSSPLTFEKLQKAVEAFAAKSLSSEHASIMEGIGLEFYNGFCYCTVVAKAVYEPASYVVECEESAPQIMSEATIFSHLTSHQRILLDLSKPTYVTPTDEALELANKHFTEHMKYIANRPIRRYGYIESTSGRLVADGMIQVLSKPAPEKKCTCGGALCGGTHSSWCDSLNGDSK